MIKRSSIYFSTGTEQILVKKLFNIINNSGISMFESTAYIEAIISDIINNEVINEGYSNSDFPKRSFYNQILRKNSFGNSFLEKYEFLFKFSNIFTNSERNKLLKAILSYREAKGIIEKDFVHESLLMEYYFIKNLQICYFKENKLYITLSQISTKITGNNSLKKHFNQKRGIFNFHPFTIFQIECWAKNNLNIYKKKINNLISEWREENNDNSLYAKQDTPFKDIAYNVIILYNLMYMKLINLNTLDELLHKRFPKHFPQHFFHRRINQDRDRKEIITSLDLGFVRK